MPNLKELSALVSEKLRLPKRATKAIIEEFFEQVSAALERGDPVQILGFGEFFFSMQDFNRPYYEEKLGIEPGDKSVRLKVCRFKFRPGLRERINGFVRFHEGDQKRIDYKSGGRAPAPMAETDRRARAGITMGAICNALNEEARRGKGSR